MSGIKEKILITGGAGFIGSNVADRYLEQGKKVVVVDNLSRAGTEKNLEWLRERHQFKDFEFWNVDIRDFSDLSYLFRRERPDAVLHLAAQVAVTTSVEDPRSDFNINLLGAFNVLEAARLNLGKNIPIGYSSTNKVYGEIDDPTEELPLRYRYNDGDLHKFGVSESQPLDFHSPYGCSKGGADQYFRDYARIYDLSTVVWRQSCIYGPRQFGNEDQGWVMHFARKAVTGELINIYGDGKQVRDVLNVTDLIDLYDASLRRSVNAKGEVYNVGGGPENTVSLRELIFLLQRRMGREIILNYEDWRPGDQKVYVSDIRKAQREIGWNPKIDIDQGLNQLIDWAKEVVKS